MTGAGFEGEPLHVDHGGPTHACLCRAASPCFTWLREVTGHAASYEIGLRRALGASRRQVAGQFLAESTTIGLLGGIVGAALGVVVVVCVAGVKQWTPVLDFRLALGAPVAGAVVGLLAGLYPSLRAARMEPADALRSPS
ncbi:ABC transporter permease [Streptomyces sp. NPDC059441]|uniref:ABC transporter permease n=1 Tax=Streptomyces sp. NPDC059441 TaxID=3346829 RepID=UPI0036B3F261